MKKHTAWWTSFAGKIAHKDILAIQIDARPKWRKPADETPPDDLELFFLTDRQEVLRGRMVKGEMQIYAIMRKGDDTKVDVVGFMYVMEFLACAMFDTALGVAQIVRKA